MDNGIREQRASVLMVIHEGEFGSLFVLKSAQIKASTSTSTMF